MADFSTLTANIAQLKSDAEALIALAPAEDPAIQAAIDSAANEVQAIDTEIKTKLGQ